MSGQITVFTIIFSIAGIFAQFEIGVKGAYNTIFIQNQNNYGQKEMDYDEHFGINPGIWLAKDICEKSQLVVESSYLKQGQEYFDNFNSHKLTKELT